ncbi:hypothetical protein K4L06_07410 [Lysobacter sp. BMK333-48F3]|uniref:hypothetical protein n=1 Tax=Lysobacter sp. BMK333-48F3 TaxID=2867962 RepID=UPI001C8B15E2|nr:hypothetical protein [Lysobacter sp. BMK333-48F3]MBX9401138.1 hypothetical protein [Lysobacter sp. BMK333-48F3]
MFKTSLLAAGALALGFATDAQAVAKDIDGYRSDRVALASQRGVFVSRDEGGSTPLRFRFSLLPLKG